MIGRLLPYLALIGLVVECGADTWTKLSPLPTGNHLNSVFFVKPRTDSTSALAKVGGFPQQAPKIVYAVGAGGTIIKSTGSSWFSLSSGTTKILQSVFFLNADTGFVAGDSGTILKTVNGGFTWLSQKSGTLQSLTAIQFINPTRGYAIGLGGTILLTKDGGATWSAQVSGTTQNLYGMHFFRSGQGWVVGQGGTILYTTGTSAWAPQASGTTETLQSIHFPDSSDSIGYAVGSGVNYGLSPGIILKAGAWGKTWTALKSTIPKGFLSVRFLDPYVGYAVGFDGQVCFTDDGGNSWAIRNTQATTLTSVDFLDANIGYAVGMGGTILSIKDINTISSINRGTGNTLLAVARKDASTVFAVGANGISCTMDSLGTTCAPTATQHGLNGVHFPTPTSGYMVGDSGTIISTSLGVQTSGTTKNLCSVFFSDALTGIAVGDSGTVLRTTSGGRAWSPQSSQTTEHLLSVYFPKPNIGYAVGWNGTIRKTIDGGVTWSSPISSGTQTTHYLYSVFFTSADTGYVVGRNNATLSTDVACIIMKTIDGGANWKIVFTDNKVIPFMRSIYFTDKNTGYAVGANGWILKTINAGASWVEQVQTSGTTRNLLSVAVNSSGLAFAVGEWGTVVRAPSVPANLLYIQNTISYPVGAPIQPLSPYLSVGDKYSVSPALPSGLSLDSLTGILSGIPAQSSPSTYYTITASNSLGSTFNNIQIEVFDPSPVSIRKNPLKSRRGYPMGSSFDWLGRRIGTSINRLPSTLFITH